MYKVIYTNKAIKDLEKIELQISQRIIKKINEYKTTNNPLIFAKRLTDSADGQYRFRIGDYRAIFDLDKNGEIKILLILKIKHRKEVYK